MKFSIEEVLRLQNAYEHIIIPYQDKNALKKLLVKIVDSHPMAPHIIEQLSKPTSTTLSFAQEEKVIKIDTIYVNNEDNALAKEIKQAFLHVGNALKHNCCIVFSALESCSDYRQLIFVGIQSIIEGAYTFNKEGLNKVNTSKLFGSRDKLLDAKEELCICIVGEQIEKKLVEKAIEVATCINYARTLSNVPNNYLHIAQMLDYAKALADSYKMGIKILRDKELIELHSGGILAVNQGSVEEAGLISIQYYGDPENTDCKAIIGKGVMFDAGGYHLKSMDGMENMKYDMCGAANVLEILEILARVKAKINVLAVIPVVENVISKSACKMGDVITTLSGKTVEVYNTDAEGRLILCDALTYAARYKVSEIIDIATLTCSCKAALGDSISGFFVNNEEAYSRFSMSSNQMGESIWRLDRKSVV